MGWGEMRMEATDLADVSGYQFLVNGKSAAQNWTGIFSMGQKIRLRFINASAMSFYDISIPGLKMKVIAADGQNVKPFVIDEFRIGIAETYDVVVEPDSDKAYTILPKVWIALVMRAQLLRQEKIWKEKFPKCVPEQF